MPGGDHEIKANHNVLRVALDLGRGTARVLGAAELRSAAVAAEQARDRAGVTVLRQHKS